MLGFLLCLALGAPSNKRFKFTSCYSGWGAKELDGGKDCGTMPVRACLAKCQDLYDCRSVTWDTETQKCFRRGYVSYERERAYTYVVTPTLNGGTF